MHIPLSTILLLLPTLTLSTPHLPLIPISPLQPRTPGSLSTPRNRTCAVTALGNSQDDSAALLSAIASCNNGGVVELHSPLYTIAKPLNLTYLSSIDFSIHGTIAFSPNVSFWSTASFKYPFQDSAAFIQFGGTDVNFYGDGQGVIDGNGQVWYDAFAKNSDVVRPILWVLNGLKGGSMSGLTMKNSPMWFNFFVGVQDFVVSGMLLEASSSSKSAVKNTDGWDTYQSSHLTIQNSTIHNQDDCVSFKPNSTDILVQNLYCNGSHGISVGSLGQYPGVTDIVQNIVVRNTTLGYASDAARIKVWAGEVPGSDSGTGGGNGVVKNITYDGMTVVKDDYAIELTSCYMQSASNCAKYPTQMLIQDVVFKNFVGVASSKHDPTVGTLVCSSKDKCSNISAQNINITTPSGKAAKWTCTNMDNSLLAINCSS